MLYFLYLFFQLKTHTHLYADTIEVEDEEEPQLSYPFAITMLVVVTVVISLCAELLVGSIEGLSKTFHLSETFVGLILLPIVGNAAGMDTHFIYYLHKKIKSI